MKAGVCGQHIPGGGSRGAVGSGACVWLGRRAAASQPPQGTRKARWLRNSPTPQGSKRASIWQHLESALASFERASSKVEARDESLSSHNSLQAPLRNKYAHTAPQIRHERPPRGAARHQAQAGPLADFQRERPAVPRTSCLPGTRRVPSPSPCPWPAFRPRSGRARAAQPPQHRHDEEIGATAAGGAGHRGAAALRQRAAPSHGSRLLDGGRKGAAPQRRAGRLPARPVPVGGRPRRRDQGDGWLALGSDPLPPQPHDLRWRRRHRHWRGRECTWLCCSAGWPSLPGA